MTKERVTRSKLMKRVDADYYGMIADYVLLGVIWKLEARFG